MTEAEIQAASKFWATGPGKAVMEKWPVEWESSDWKACLTRTDNDTWELLLLNDSGNPAFMPPETIEYRCAIDRIHGHYLDMLQQWAESRGLGVGLIWPIPDDRRFNICIPLDDGGSALNVVEPTLHEALKAAMEAAFGEET